TYGAALTTDQLPPEVRQDAETTFSEDWMRNNPGELRWRLTSIPIDDLDAYVPDPTLEPEFEERAQELADEIKASGRFQPVVIGPESFEGHHRARAARLLGMKEVPAYAFEQGRPE